MATTSCPAAAAQPAVTAPKCQSPTTAIRIGINLARHTIGLCDWSEFKPIYRLQSKNGTGKREAAGEITQRLVIAD